MHPFALLQPKFHQIARTEKEMTSPLSAGDREQHKALASGTRRRRSALSRPLQSKSFDQIHVHFRRPPFSEGCIDRMVDLVLLPDQSFALGILTSSWHALRISSFRSLIIRCQLVDDRERKGEKPTSTSSTPTLIRSSRGSSLASACTRCSIDDSTPPRLVAGCREWYQNLLR